MPSTKAPAIPTTPQILCQWNEAGAPGTSVPGPKKDRPKAVNGFPLRAPRAKTRTAGRRGESRKTLSILQNPGKDIVVDVAASRYQSYAFSPNTLPLFERGGQAGRT